MRRLRVTVPALVAFAVVVSAWIHSLAGFTLPLPWDDEVSFLWPAQSFAEHGVLRSDSLNPDREIFWMPPGYMVAMGALFKATGFSLAWVRWTSWAFTALAFAGLVWFMARYPLALVSAGLLTLNFWSGTWVAVGNIGRMDALLLAMAVGAFLLLQRDRHWSALSLLALGLLVHPNSGYFGLAALVWTLGRRGLGWGRPAAGDVAWMAATVAAWIAYVIHVAPNIHHVVSDLSAQFARKSARAPILNLMTWTSIAPIAWGAGLAAVAAVRRRDVLLPLLFATACYFIIRIGHEMWYEVFNHIAFILLGALTLALVWDALRSRPRWAAAGVAALLLPLLSFYYRHGFIEGPRGFPRDMEWGWGMRMSDGTPYLTPDDRAAVLSALRAAAPTDEMVRIAFYPSGDGLYHSESGWPSNWIPFEPHFTDERADLLVARRSRYIPAWWAEKESHAFSAVVSGEKPFRERDGTEQWYLADLRELRRIQQEVKE